MSESVEVKVGKMETRIEDMSKEITEIKDDIKKIRVDVEGLKIALAKYATAIGAAWIGVEIALNYFFK